MSPKYVLVPLRRMRRRVSDRASRSKYDGCRAPVTAGPAAPAELVVAGAIGCGAGGGAGGAVWCATESTTSVAGSDSEPSIACDAGRNAAQHMKLTKKSVAAAT